MSRRRVQALIAEFFALVRFGIVGLSATGIYLACATWLELTTGLQSQLVHLIAMGLSLLFSYLGHFYVTYRLEAGHRRYSQRFVAVTALIVITATLLQKLVITFGGSAFISYVAVTVYYPLASVAIHHFWTFLRGRPANVRD